MRKMMSEVLQYYDKEVVRMIIEKYNVEPMEAIRRFISSKTHAMLENTEYEMGEFGCPAIFDMWECEQVTGDPRNASYIRGE